jgi:hypothetical protein
VLGTNDFAPMRIWLRNSDNFGEFGVFESVGAVHLERERRLSKCRLLVFPIADLAECLLSQTMGVEWGKGSKLAPLADQEDANGSRTRSQTYPPALARPDNSNSDHPCPIGAGPVRVAACETFVRVHCCALV